MRRLFVAAKTHRFNVLNLFTLSLAASFVWVANASAQPTPQPSRSEAARPPGMEPLSINDWLTRAREASRKMTYVGTFVVSSDGAMSSSKVSHTYEGDQEVERVETLSGAPRLIFRHNEQIVTFLLDKKVVRTERRDSTSAFPGWANSADQKIADFYRMRTDGVERVAGFEADVTTLIPKDAIRFGYRVWTEQSRGLPIKSQTLDSNGKVLDQAAFSELQLDAPVRLDKLVQMMRNVEGYRIEKTALVKTTASAEGWSLRVPVAGFVPLNFYRRPAGIPDSMQNAEALQWIFSDGMASLSIFVEPLNLQRHTREVGFSMGATQTLTRQVAGYWLTLVGEVPMATLRLFADNLEHRK